MSKLDSTRLRELFDYNPNTGVFTWRIKPARRILAGAVAGAVRPDKYVVLRVDRAGYLAHRAAWCYVYGDWPTGVVDHINGVRNDNRICNLRDVSSQVNSRNVHAPQRNNTSGFRGVFLHRPSGRWRAQIRIRYRHTHLGYFDTPEAASAAYEAAKTKCIQQEIKNASD